MIKWSYRVLTAGPGSPNTNALDEDKLNELGLEGWELVTILWDGAAYRVYLKRLVS